MDNQLKNEIVLSSVMKQMVSFNGYSVSKIAEDTGLTIQQIKKTIRSTDFNELRVDYGIDKLNIAGKLKDLLDNDDPKIQLASISEINKMSGDYKSNINLNVSSIDPNILAMQKIYQDVDVYDVEPNELIENDDEKVK